MSQTQFSSSVFHVKATSVSVTLDATSQAGSGDGTGILPTSADDLEINVALIASSDDYSQILCLVSVDALYAGPQLQKFASSILSEFCPPLSIVVAASHTHSAPMIDETKPGLGEFSPASLASYKRALEQVPLRLRESDWQLCSALFSEWKVPGVSLRRRKVPVSIQSGRISFGKVLQYPGAIDVAPIAGSITFSDSSGDQVLCMSWVPCHPVSFPNNDRFSPDYVGSLRSAYRESFSDSNLPFVFMQGASGDLRPTALSARAPQTLRERAARLLFGVPFGRHSQEEFKAWIESLTSNFLASLDSIGDQPATLNYEPISFERLDVPLANYFSGPYVQKRTITFYSWALGKRLFFGISGEPTSEVQDALVQRLGCDVTTAPTLIGCLGDSFGYIASERQRPNLGYEVRGFLTHFDMEEIDSRDLLGDFLEFAAKVASNVELPQSRATGTAR